jgi:hypothetical protein
MAWFLFKRKIFTALVMGAFGAALAAVYPLYAESVLTSEQTVHDVAHAGGSYALTSVGEVACTGVFSKAHRLECTLIATLTAIGAGIAKEVLMDSGETNHKHFRGIAADATGVGAAVGVISISW